MRPGLNIVPDQRCPHCGSALFIRPACCSMRKKGWRTILKCTKAGCGYKIGYKKA